MARKSKIERAPSEAREKLNEAYRSGRFDTLDKLLDYARTALGLDVSLSSLHRHTQKLDVVGERIRRSKDMAAALVDRFGDVPENKAARLNIQFLHSAIMDLMSAADDEGEPLELTPVQVMALAKAVSDLARAEKTDADRMLKVRKEAAEEALSAVDEELKKAKQPGLSKETVAAIRQKVLGVQA
jgi:hypothetical protein